MASTVGRTEFRSGATFGRPTPGTGHPTHSAAAAPAAPALSAAQVAPAALAGPIAPAALLRSLHRLLLLLLRLPARMAPAVEPRHLIHHKYTRRRVRLDRIHLQDLRMVGILCILSILTMERRRLRSLGHLVQPVLSFHAGRKRPFIGQLRLVASAPASASASA